MGKKLSVLSKLAVKPDQALMFPVYNQQGTLLAEKGTLLTLEQIEIIEGLDRIYTDERSLKSALVHKSGHNTEQGTAYKAAAPFKRLTALEKTLHAVYTTPDDKKNQERLSIVINRLQSICRESPDAAIAKIITDNNTDYTIKHAIHTAILCELSGRYLKWEKDKRGEIIGAALTMNVSLGYLQDKLLNQATPLSAVQKKIINKHPAMSVASLERMGINNPTWLELVLKHHESIDGSGYPSGLEQKDIPMEASLISLSDIYCAKVTGRNYREPIFANVAVRDIYLEKKQHYENTLIEVFVKLLGVYPPGCVVKLQSNEVGIVIRRSKKLDSPEVLLINDAKGEPLILKVKRQTSQKIYAVKSIIRLDPVTSDMNYDDIWPS